MNCVKQEPADKLEYPSAPGDVRIIARRLENDVPLVRCDQYKIVDMSIGLGLDGNLRVINSIADMSN